MKTLIKGKTISYKKLGKGKKTVLFVHGWSGNKASLEGLAKGLRASSNAYTCYLIDLLGRGDSDLPEKDWGIEDYSNVLKEFIETIIGKETYYIGHSFGGALGISLASTSNVISKLVLCAPSYKRSMNPKDQDTASKSAPTSWVRIKKILTPLRKVYYKIFYPNSDNFKIPQLESNFRKIITQDLTGYLETISIPTLILWGADDIETPLNDAYVLHEKIKSSELVIKGSYGHELPVYYPEVITNEINSFF